MVSYRRRYVSMNLVRGMAGLGLAAALMISMSACGSSGSSGSDNSQSAATAMPAATGAMAGGGAMSGAAMAPSDTGKDTMMGGEMHGRFGGPVYTGAPALNVTAALVAAGGGPEYYSTAK